MLEFPNQYELTSTMLRPQEYYESSFPQIRENVFTLETYMDLYAEEHGNFTYYSDWNGFNIPSDVLCSFFSDYEHASCELSKKEKKLLHMINVAIDDFDYEEDNRFYLIAYVKGNSMVVEHEFAHSGYYLNPGYKNKQNENVKSLELSVKDQMIDILRRLGYCDNVIDDEIQAYLSTDTPEYFESRFGINRKEFEKVRKPFVETFEEYKRDI